MISYVAGELVATTATSVIIDHQGIGLEELVPDSLLSKMPVAGSQVKIYQDDCNCTGNWSENSQKTYSGTEG